MALARTCAVTVAMTLSARVDLGGFVLAHDVRDDGDEQEYAQHADRRHHEDELKRHPVCVVVAFAKQRRNICLKYILGLRLAQAPVMSKLSMCTLPSLSSPCDDAPPASPS